MHTVFQHAFGTAGRDDPVEEHGAACHGGGNAEVEPDEGQDPCRHTIWRYP
jgi:hypothetical protein